MKDSFKGSLVTSEIFREISLNILFKLLLIGKELAANVSYLIQLGENPQTLAEEYLSSITNRLDSELNLLKAAHEVNT